MRLDLTEHGIGGQHEHLILAGNMAIQHRGAGLQLGGEVAHAQRAQPFAVDQLKGAGDDAIQRDGNAPGRLRPALAGCPPRRRPRRGQILLILSCLFVPVPAMATLYPQGNMT